MNKPNEYDAIQAGGEFTPVELGGHKAVIKKVEERTTATGKPMIVVAIDFDRADKQPGYFAKMFAEDDRPEKKWPYQAMQYIATEDNDGKCSRSFKSFMTSFEKSNNVKAVWGDGFAAQFKDKKLGVVFGEVEEEYNGEVKTRRRIRWTCEYDHANEAKVPPLKEHRPQTATTGPADFMTIPDGADDEIPF